MKERSERYWDGVCVCQWQRLILGDEKCKGVALTFISLHAIKCNVFFHKTGLPNYNHPPKQTKTKTGNRKFFFLLFIYFRTKHKKEPKFFGI